MNVSDMEHLASLANVSSTEFMLEQMQKALDQHKVTPTEKTLDEIRFTSQMIVLKAIIESMGLSDALIAIKKAGVRNSGMPGFIMPSSN